jgi:hypothetical protein
MMTVTDKLRVGDLVEVRSKEEILATLDSSGRLDGLPFMPQMFKYCGGRFTVLARAHKTCDVVGGEERRLPDGIHLDTRCDGEAYGGCQMACLIFWKEAWLKPVARQSASDVTPPPVSSNEHRGGAEKAAPSCCTEEDVLRATHRTESGSGETTYFCQATRVPYFTQPLAWWDVRQYIEDYTSGNVSLRRLISGLLYQTYNHGTQAWRNKVGRPGRWAYDVLQHAIGGVPFPIKGGTLPPGKPTPVAELNLQRGELVRIKSHADILATLNRGGLNRGLLFDKEMVPFCGKVFRVKTRVTIFVDENTGKMRTMKTPAVILEGVWCQSRYSNKKMLCPRALYSWWREAWLERVSDSGDPITKPLTPSAEVTM